MIALGLSYAPEADPLATLAPPDRGNISVYARNRDYHDVVKGMLKHLAQFVVSRFGPAVKVFVDTAPVMEKPLAQAAGLGWQGKHTNLVSRSARVVAVPGRGLHHAGAAAGLPRGRRCGTCDAVPGRLPDRRVPGAIPSWMRRAASPT